MSGAVRWTQLLGSLCVTVAEIREEEFFIVNLSRSLSSGKEK